MNQYFELISINWASPLCILHFRIGMLFILTEPAARVASFCFKRLCAIQHACDGRASNHALDDHGFTCRVESAVGRSCRTRERCDGEQRLFVHVLHRTADTSQPHHKQHRRRDEKHRAQGQTQREPLQKRDNETERHQRAGNAGHGDSATLRQGAMGGRFRLRRARHHASRRSCVF